MAAVASSSSSSSSSSVVPRKEWTYDVFLNFRATDASNNFVDRLYTALTTQGIRVFKEGETQRKEWTLVRYHLSELYANAIKESRFAVVVFSKNYAYSSWCLEELKLIMECRNEMGQKVLPVFYDIDHSYVREQKEEYERAFENHDYRFRMYSVNKVKYWRDALTEAACLDGYDIIKSSYDMGESASITKIVKEILADVNPEKIRSGYQHGETSGKQIGKLFVSVKEIGRGSNGTSVLEGTYDTRPVAVKRVLISHHDVASKEIQNLIYSDHLPNIVRYYGVEYDDYFIYIALERCICSLHELILTPNNPTVQFQQLTSEFESIKLPNGYPSPKLLKVMRDTVAGLAHLHKLGFIHRDLKPQNVLIYKYSSISAKVSDMGISKRLLANKSSLTGTTGYGSSGWQAPETLRKGRETIAVDLFSLGCLLFFCITGGGHPFGDDINHDRVTNILKNIKDLSSLDNIPEAFDLVSNLIHRVPESRPYAAEVYHHPLFWNPDKRLSFFRDASDRVELEDRVPGSVLLTALESIGTVAFGSQWDDKLDSTLLNDLNSGRYRNYKYNKVRDLLRVIRNKYNHYRAQPEDVQAVLGEVPKGFEGYFSSRFPKLLMEVYKVLKQYCVEEKSLEKEYYEKTLD